MANEKGTTVYEIQRKFQSIFGFTLPLFHGRGLLNCEWFTIRLTHAQATTKDNVGLMPYRRPITVVCKCCDFKFSQSLHLLSSFSRSPDSYRKMREIKSRGSHPCTRNLYQRAYPVSSLLLLMMHFLHLCSLGSGIHTRILLRQGDLKSSALSRELSNYGVALA